VPGMGKEKTLPRLRVEPVEIMLVEFLGRPISDLRIAPSLWVYSAKLGTQLITSNLFNLQLN